MTSLLTPPQSGSGDSSRTTEPSGARRRPAAASAVLAALTIAGGGLLASMALAVIGWLAASTGVASSAIRLGANGWLLVHGVPFEVPGGAFGLAPLGLTGVLLWFLFQAGAWVGRTSALSGLRSLAAGIGVFAGSYGAFAAFVAAAEGFDASPVRAFVQGVLFAGFAGGLGLVVATGRAGRVWSRLSDEVRTSILGAGLALAVLCGAAVVVYLLSLLFHLGRVTEQVGALGVGPIDGLLLLLLCTAYLPNAVLCTVGYILGPGFALGIGTVVAPTATEIGPLPMFPLLAAVPGAGPPPAWVLVVLAFPLAAGAVSGVLVVRRNRLLGLEAAGLYGGLSGLLAGLGVTVLAVLARGSAGPGRMAEIGPDPWQVGVVAVMTLAVSGALAALGWAWWTGRRPPSVSEHGALHGNS